MWEIRFKDAEPLTTDEDRNSLLEKHPESREWQSIAIETGQDNWAVFKGDNRYQIAS